MANNRKMTNAEIMAEVAQMGEQDALNMGVTPELQDAAKEGIARGNVNGYMAARIGTYSPLYNAFVGFVSKIVHQSITKATYRDKWAKHRRGMVSGGDVELAFMRIGDEGDGNTSAISSSYFPTSGATITSNIEANIPQTLHSYDKVVEHFIARVPVGRHDYTDAFTTEYGINDLIDKMRESALHDVIQSQINVNMGLKFSEPLQGSASLFADTSTPTAATVTGRARFHALKYVDSQTGVNSKIDFNSWTDAELMDVYTSIKAIAYRMAGDPTTKYNVYGAENNVASLSNLVCYINSDLWAVLTTRVNSAAFNKEELKEAGLEIRPLMAEFIDSMATSANAISASHKGSISSGRARCVGFIADEKYIEEWTLADDTHATPAERNEILSRFYDGLITRRDYACNCYLVCECPATL